MPATLLAVEQKEIWGFATTGPSQDTNLPNLRELWAIYVDPQHWGQGVGRLLMTAARDRLRGDGAREALLWVFAGNERARRFYEIDGWRADGARRTEAIGELAMKEVRYRCVLI